MSLANVSAVDLLPPLACPDEGFTPHGYLLTLGSVYSVALASVLTSIAHTVYKKWKLYDDAEAQIQRFGTLWVISTFFLALGVYVAGYVVRCKIGCSTYASECASISCVVANFVPEGYVILAVLLLVACVAILRSVNAMSVQRLQLAGMQSRGLHTHHSCSFAVVGEWMLRIGFVLTVITGLIPSPMSNCGVQPKEVTAVVGDDCFNTVLSNFHTGGIIGGLVIAILGTLMRLFGKRSVNGEWRSFQPGGPYITAMIVISLVFLLLPGIVFLVIYAINDSSPAAEVDFCSLYTTRDGCSGKELPSLWYTWASARKMESNPKLTQDGWQCKWLENVAMTSSPCVMANCDLNGRLGQRKLAIVAEFIGLVTGVYGIYFGIWTISILDMTIREFDKADKQADNKAVGG